MSDASALTAGSMMIANSWDQWGKHVLAEQERVADELKENSAAVKQHAEDDTNRMIQIREELHDMSLRFEKHDSAVRALRKRINIQHGFIAILIPVVHAAFKIIERYLP